MNSNLSSFLNISEYKNNPDIKSKKTVFRNNSFVPNENSKINSANSINSNLKQKCENIINIKKDNIQINYFDNRIKLSYTPKDYISLNIFDYIFCKKNEKMSKLIKLYNLSKIYYRKKMDIVHIFTLLCILEENFSKIINQNIYINEYN